MVALKAALQCEAVNVGINLGAAAGGSQSDHLHVHCVPRWVGDANFIAVAGETRVLSVSLDDVYRVAFGGRDLDAVRSSRDRRPADGGRRGDPDAAADSDASTSCPTT